MWAKIKMGSGKSLLVLKKYNVADILRQAFDSRLREKKITQKMSFLPKSQFFCLPKTNFEFLWKKLLDHVYSHHITPKKVVAPRNWDMTLVSNTSITSDLNLIVSWKLFWPATQNFNVILIHIWTAYLATFILITQIDLLLLKKT